jgi:hypothetical protein
LKLSETVQHNHTIYTLTAITQNEKELLNKFNNLNDPTSLQCVVQNNKLRIWFADETKKSIGGKLIEI